MIIGASSDTDQTILNLTENLYNKYKLKRVYYSAYVHDNLNTSSLLPCKPPNLVRENRLYQADWLLRFYGFSASEILPQGNLDENLDPKCAWALKNLNKFPIEINTASYENLLKVPGIGLTSAYKIIHARRYTKLTYDDLLKMKIVLKRAIHFITVGGKFFGEREKQISTVLNTNRQISIFDNELTISALNGQF